jgi:hypothetical protein
MVHAAGAASFHLSEWSPYTNCTNAIQDQLAYRPWLTRLPG